MTPTVRILKGRHLGADFDVEVVVHDNFTCTGFEQSGYSIRRAMIDGKDIDKEDLIELEMLFNFIQSYE